MKCGITRRNASKYDRLIVIYVKLRIAFNEITLQTKLQNNIGHCQGGTQLNYYVIR